MGVIATGAIGQTLATSSNGLQNDAIVTVAISARMVMQVAVDEDGLLCS
jgi:hypothetical protein